MTLAVALGIIGVPLIDACAGDTRGLAACLRDMAERKFDLPGRQADDAAGPLPAASPAIAEKLAPVSEAPAVGEGAALASTHEIVADAPGEGGQGGPLLSPADETAGPSPQDVALADTMEPMIEAPVAAPILPAALSPDKEPAPAATVPLAPAAPTTPIPADGAAVLEADAPQPSIPEALPVAETEPPPSSPVAAWLPLPDPIAAFPPRTADSRAETRIANVEPPPLPPPPVVAAPVAEAPTIDAIELEGDASYISGSGPAGALIRLYADGDLLGESPVADGRWLIEAGPILSQPRRELRAKAVEPDTGKLLGEAVITVEIQGPDAPSSPETAPAPDSTTAPDPSGPSASAARGAAPQPAPDDAAASVGSADRPSPDSAVPAEPAPAATAPAAPREDVRDMPATSVGEPLPPLDAIVPREESASVQILPPPSQASGAELPAYAGSVVDLPSPSAPALVAEFKLPSEPAAGSVAMLTLIPFGDPVEGRFTGGKAIIRHGDTLWSIAHRYYGSGIHYRTIFKANRDLIARPSKIFPGQVFDLPLVTDE